MSKYFDDLSNVDNNEDEDIITLFNSDTGEDEEYLHFGTFDYKDKWYIVLKPYNDSINIDGDVLMYEILEDENGDDVFAVIEDKGLLSELEVEFNRLVSESFPDEE